MTPIKRFLLMVALTCMWSPSFLFIKLSINEMPPLLVVSLRVTLAAMVLGLILTLKRTSLPANVSFWGRTAIMALFSSVFPFCLFCYAELSIDSAVAAILNGTSLMFTAMLAQIFVPTDKMNVQKSIGIALSSIGVVWLFAPQLQEGVSGTTLGMAAATLAAFCYAVSHVYGKLFITGQKPFIAPTAQLLVSALLLWPVTFYKEQVWTLPMPSFQAIMGVCGLAFLGTVCAFIIYYKLLEHCGPTAISMVSCFFPVGGMLLGFVFLGETFTTNDMLASSTIILGMLTMNDVVSFNFLRRPQGVVNEPIDAE